MTTIKENREESDLAVYDGGKIIGYVSWSEVIRTDTWGGARIGQEWKEGEVEIEGKIYPVMCDGDETYVIFDEHYVSIDEDCEEAE